MGKFVFDGAERKIFMNPAEVDGSVVVFTTQELWTEWVRWVSQDDNSKYLPAFESVMIELDSTTLLGQYLFIRNDLGWRVVPPEADHISIIINGSFFAKDSTLPVMINRIKQETDLVINRSTLTSTPIINSGNNLDTNTILTKLSELQSLINNYPISGGLTTEQHNKLMKTATKQDVFNASLL